MNAGKTTRRTFIRSTALGAVSLTVPLCISGTEEKPVLNHPMPVKFPAYSTETRKQCARRIRRIIMNNDGGDLYNSPPDELETALINIKEGQMSLAVPRTYVRHDLFSRSNLSQSLDLLRVRF